MDLAEREADAANYHLGAKEALFDRHGYGAPRRWTATFAWNLFESLLAVGAIRFCPDDYHECEGTRRIDKVAVAMGLAAKTRHWFQRWTDDDGRVAGAFIYEVRANGARLEMSAEAIEMFGDPAIDQLIYFELDHHLVRHPERA